ncbi:MAG: flagellar motor switch protein FliN [Gammaproteobacteria bacterium]|nr:flagellar motor switch protein FliN [Gammaproteobacteria bacterium]
MTEETQQPEADEQVDDWGAAMAEQGDTEIVNGDATDPSADVMGSSSVNTDQQTTDNYQPAALKELDNRPGQLTTSDANLDVILDIPVTLSMEIGRTELPIHNLLQLNQGSVVELDRLAGEPLDVLINGTLIAHGEVVVVNEKFGIRLTDVISPAERVKKLK